MLMNRMKIRIDLNTGESTSEIIGTKEVPEDEVMEGLVGLLTGLSMDECCKQIEQLRHV